MTAPRVASGGGLSVRRGDLAGLDELEAEAVAVFCWQDVRPLRGVAGFLDWRLSGAISQAIISGAFGAKAEEVMLLPTWGRFGQKRVFAFGLGRLADFDPDSLRQTCDRAAAVIRKAGARSIAWAAPAASSRAEVESSFVEVVSQVESTPSDSVILVEELAS